MLQIGLCDDRSEARMSLRVMLERILLERDVEHQLFEFSSGEGLLKWLSMHVGELDLVFLDIEMGELNGMETAKHLRASDESLQLVFVTGFSDFVFDGYGVGALGYLLKPPKMAQLDEVLTRALGALHCQAEKVFLCRLGDAHYRIPRSAISYFFSERRQVICVTPERSYSFYGKLDEVEEELGEDFVRIHQRYLVRAAAVERVEGSEILLAGERLPISRSYQSVAMLALTRAVLD